MRLISIFFLAVSDGAISETDPNDQLNDHNQKQEFAAHESDTNSSNQLAESNCSVKRKKSSRRSSSPKDAQEEATSRDDEQSTERSDEKPENSSTASKSKRTRRDAKMSAESGEEDNNHLESGTREEPADEPAVEQEEPANETDKPQSSPSAVEQPAEEESEDKRNQNAMRALFSRLQGIDSEPADLLSACNKKKKKTKAEADHERGAEQAKRNKRKDEDEPASDTENADEEMQCDEDASSLNQSWSSGYGHKKTTRLANKLLNDPSNGVSSEGGQLTGSNKKRKLNQQAKTSPTNPLINQLNSKDLAANDMLAKYQSQFALLLNNPMNANEQLMNSFLAAAVNNNLTAASPSNHLVGALSSNLSSMASPSNLAAASPSPKSTSINTSSSLDKLTSIVDSIDKINVNQTKASSSASSNNGLNCGNSTPGLSDSDNGSNLLLQLPTLSSLNKPLQSKNSPSTLFGSGASPAAFQDVFNNMKLLPHQLLELQQQQASQLFQPAPIKSPSSSSTHSSHSSSPSPNFFGKQSSNTLSSLASTLSGLTSGLNSNQMTAKQLAAAKKSAGGHQKSAQANQALSANQSIKLSQQQQLNNLLRQHAALQLLQQAEQQAEQPEMFDELENKDDDEDEDDAFDYNSQLLKLIRKQMQKSQKPEEPLLNSSPLDLSCKQAKDAGAQSALNALIASKLLESGGAAGLAGLGGLQNLAGLGSLFGSPALSNLAGNLGINNLNQLNQLNSLLSANNLLNSNQNKQQQFGRFDLLSSLLGASNQQQQQQQQQNLMAAINPLLGLNQQMQQQGSKKKDQQAGSFNKTGSSPSSSGQLLGSQLVNPNSGSNFWNLSNTAKIKPYSASSSLHTPNPKAMQLRERSSSGQGRANPWQTQWMNRSSEQNRDVFTCVYCRMTFNSLDEMTQHMKVSPRCGMAGMQQANAVSAASSSTHSVGSNSVSTSSSGAERTIISASSLSSATSQPPAKSKHSTGSAGGNLSSSASLMLGKEKDKSGNPVPRKLVRGQDVWLGRGAEQTRQILKCK